MNSSNWRFFPLEDCMEAIIDYRGKTPRKSTLGIPLITAKIVKGGQILEPTEFIPFEDFDERMQRGIPKAGDIVITTEAPLGEVGQLDNRKLSVGQRLITLRGKKGFLDNTFLKYLMMSEFVQNQLSARETGTTVSGIKQSELRKIELPIPPISTQNRIAEILSSLDDKINLNRQTNAKLEAIAQAIFKEWFVNFNFPGATGEMVESELGLIPKGWRVGKLGGVCKITMGQSPPGESYNMNEIGIPFFQGRADFGFRFPQKRVFTTEPKRFANRYDTLVSVRAPVGDMNIAADNCCIGRGLAAVIEVNGNSSFTYYFIKELTRKFKSFEDNGTVFGSINKNEFEGMKCIIPCDENISDFEKNAKPIDYEIYINDQQSKTLAKIRDALLPKLMNGEIDV